MSDELRPRPTNGPDHESGTAVDNDSYREHYGAPYEDRHNEPDYDRRENSPPSDDAYDPDVFELVGDVLQRPTKAFAYLGSARAERIGIALLIFLLSQVPLTWLQNPLAVQSPLARLIGSAIVGMVALVFAAGVVHLCARILGGRNRYGNMLQAQALASLPYLLTTPFLVVGLATGNLLWIDLISMGASIWTTVLSVIAIREVYSFSTLRAVGTFFLPVAVTVGLVLIGSILAAVLFGSTLGL